MKKPKGKTPPALTLATPAPTDREKMWAAMRQEKVFTQALIARLAGCGKSKVQDYMQALVAAGIVRAQGTKRQVFVKTWYELVRDTGVDAPRVRKDGTLLPPSGRTRMWNAMRALKMFTDAELAQAAGLPDAPIAVSEAAYYCRWLKQGGYLGGGFRESSWDSACWVFVPAKFTGAKAPQVLRIKALFDPNLGEVVCQATPEGRDDE